MEKPHTEITGPKHPDTSPAAWQPLDPETATVEQLQAGFKYLFGFQDNVQVSLVRGADARGKRHVRIAYPGAAIAGGQVTALIGEIKTALQRAELTDAFSEGVATMKMSAPIGTIEVGLSTLEFDISGEDRQKTRAVLAGCINAAVAANPDHYAQRAPDNRQR